MPWGCARGATSSPVMKALLTARTSAIARAEVLASVYEPSSPERVLVAANSRKRDDRSYQGKHRLPIRQAGVGSAAGDGSRPRPRRPRARRGAAPLAARWISFLVDRHKAAEAGSALYRHVHQRWSRLPAADRPRLLVFGESLGSFGAEAAFRGGDAAASLANPVAGSDGALFTGPTASNHIWDQLTDDREPGSPVWRPVYDGGTRVRPEWTDRPEGYDVPARAGWYPIVTGLQRRST